MFAEEWLKVFGVSNTNRTDSITTESSPNTPIEKGSLTFPSGQRNAESSNSMSISSDRIASPPSMVRNSTNHSSLNELISQAAEKAFQATRDWSEKKQAESTKSNHSEVNLQNTQPLQNDSEEVLLGDADVEAISTNSNTLTSQKRSQQVSSTTANDSVKRPRLSNSRATDQS